MKPRSRLRRGFIRVGFVVGLVAGSHRGAHADIMFGATTNLGTPINTSSNDGTPFISRDGLSLYFASTRPGGQGNHDLWVATRASITDAWSEPVHLGATVNSFAQDWGPSVKGDGLTVYFRSNRSGGLGQGDIWVSTRSSADAPWPGAVNAGPGINTSSDECQPCISADGLELYFGSTRPGGTGADDLYVVTRPSTSASWSDAVNLGPSVNSTAVDACPSISPDGLTLFFNSTRSSGFGNYDLYVITRPAQEAPWSAAVNLGAAINTADDEMTPSFWAEGSVIYFCSWADRPGAYGGADLWRAAIDPVVDFNGDERVDTADLLVLIACWGQDDPLCDIGPTALGDGIVDAADLEVLMGYWGQQIPDPSLVAYWRLDETEGIVAYDSIGNHDGTAIGTPLWRPDAGKIGGALEFDGTYFLVADSVLDPSDGPLSVFAWVKGGGPGQAVLSQVSGANWLMADASGSLMTELRSASRLGTLLLSDAVITDGQWHRLGFTWDGSTRSLYVDDVLVAQDTATGLADCYGGLNIGCGRDMSAGTFFSGLIDDVRIYNRAVKP